MAENKSKLLKCIICGEPYRGCRSCEGRTRYKPWMNVCDTPDHYEIYKCIQGIQSGTITNSEAKKILDGINISSKDLNGLLPSVKDILKDLFVEKSKEKTVAKAAEKEKKTLTEEHLFD